MVRLPAGQYRRQTSSNAVRAGDQASSQSTRPSFRAAARDYSDDDEWPWTIISQVYEQSVFVVADRNKGDRLHGQHVVMLLVLQCLVRNKRDIAETTKASDAMTALPIAAIAFASSGFEMSAFRRKSTVSTALTPTQS